MGGGSASDYKLLGHNLWQQVLIGLVLGIAVGYFLKEEAAGLKILGTIFLNLIKMMVVPLIFLALTSGITSMDDMGSFRRMGIKGFSAYLLTASFAVVLGILVGLILEPGKGVDIDSAELSHSTPTSTSAAAPPPPPTAGEFLLNLIPTNAIRAMAEDQFLQVVVFSIFLGVSMNLVAEKCQTARVVVREMAQVVFRMIENIVKLAPFAVFGYMAWSVGTQGLEIIVTLGKLVIAVLVACILQYVIFGVIITLFGRLSPFPFYKKILTTQLMAFSTSSSKATLTTAMREVQEKLGVSEKSANFLLPLGACINMDGTAIYLGLCAVFFAQLFGIDLQMHQYLLLILTCTLGSIGAAGIPSGSIIFMGMVLGSVGLPLEGIALILGVDRILDMVRTTINITGDCTITLVVDNSEGLTDKGVYYS